MALIVKYKPDKGEEDIIDKNESRIAVLAKKYIIKLYRGSTKLLIANSILLL